jgi:hypothetical protein
METSPAVAVQEIPGQVLRGYSPAVANASDPPPRPSARAHDMVCTAKGIDVTFPMEIRGFRSI